MTWLSACLAWLTEMQRTIVPAQRNLSLHASDTTLYRVVRRTIACTRLTIYALLW